MATTLAVSVANNAHRACERSVSGAERAEERVERSGAWSEAERLAERGADAVENDGAGAELNDERVLQKNNGAERVVAKRRVGVTEIGRSVERLFRCSRSAHMLWTHSVII